MLNIVIFGPPGSGKGTQSTKIVEKYNLIHLSTGDLLREEMENETPLGKEVRQYIDKGLLVPDEIVLKELYMRTSEHMDSPGFIFDGFPRTIVQAESLDEMLRKEGMSISLVISVEVEEEELHKRLMGRGEDSGRSDDSDDIIIRRLEVYKEQTLPLIAYYKKQGKMATINGMAPVDQVFGKISRAIDTYLESHKIIPVVE
ncbi:MAG: adenylate kinase [Bacteroidia bacterium]|nr:MAG: adenylate kinase [Bacteroidia bacterium]